MSQRAISTLAEEQCDRWIHQAILAISSTWPAQRAWALCADVVLSSSTTCSKGISSMCRGSSLHGAVYSSESSSANSSDKLNTHSKIEKSASVAFTNNSVLKKIDLSRTASVFVPASSRQRSIVSLAFPRWKRVTSAREKGGDPRTGQAKKGDDSDPGLASRRDCFLTATARRPEAVVWAPLVGRPADYLPSGTAGQ